MRRFVHRAFHGPRLSTFEGVSLCAGLLLIAEGIGAAALRGDAGGASQVVGAVGLVAIVVCVASRGVRHYRAGIRASLPTSVARVPIRTRPHRAFSAITAVLAFGLPLATAGATVAVFAWGWLAVASVLLIGGACVIVASKRDGPHHGEAEWERTSERGTELLQRLCMRAGMRAPRLVVRSGPTATAWTAGGQIHVTRRLLELLDDAELEAVLAHELAHLAHQDAIVMEICAAPSRVMLEFARSVVRWLARGLSTFSVWTFPGGAWLLTMLVTAAALCSPVAFIVGWMSRLSVLGISRAREFSADASAATLTGRPSALGSALLKLERQREWSPHADLRLVGAHDVLCIVGLGRRGLGRLFSTHPPTAARVRRLQDLESRIHPLG